MAELAESRSELDRLRNVISRRLAELQDLVQQHGSNAQFYRNSLESGIPQKAVPPAIPVVSRQRPSRIVVSTETRRLQPPSISLLSRMGIQPPSNLSQVDSDYHRARLSSCISDIRDRLSRIRDPPYTSISWRNERKQAELGRSSSVRSYPFKV